MERDEATPQNEEVMRKILQNQRLIMEQNAKILQQQERAREEDNESNRIARDKVPLIVKVSTTNSDNAK